MKRAILLTKNPSIYRRTIEISPLECTVILSPTRLPKEDIFQLYLIDTDGFSYRDLPFDDKILSSVIFAEKQVLLSILRYGLPGDGEELFWELPNRLHKIFDAALLQFAFTPSLNGYCYLKQAFYYQHLNRNRLSAVKKDIYEAVSQCFSTSVHSVERSITFAIRKAYSENPMPFQALFPAKKNPPSNMAFLKTFFIYLEQKNYL